MINKFKNVKSPQVMEEIEFSQFIEAVRNPNQSILYTIKEARELRKNGNIEEYDLIKTKELPCYTLNFTYNKYKKDANTKEASGVIYIDIDNDVKINLDNKYIMAKWNSLSNNGIGLAVKVDGLTKDNFKSTYLDISSHLGIDPDMNACKPSQFTVQSYDPFAFYNDNSKAWVVSKCNYEHYTTNTTLNNENTPITYSKKKKKKVTNEVGVELVYDNLHEIDFEGKDYLTFENERLKCANLFIPYTIKKGSRNSIISTIAYQIKALNPTISSERYKKVIYGIAGRCDVPMENSEIELIIQKNLNKNDLNPNLNKERLVVFNPESSLSQTEKYKIVGGAVGRVKKKKSKLRTEKGIKNWDILKDGKISQIALAKKVGMCENTINEYYRYFKSEINKLKADFIANREKKK